MHETLEDRARQAAHDVAIRLLDNMQGLSRDNQIGVIAGTIRAAEQEAAVQARAAADVKWANELSRLLADGEQRGRAEEQVRCALVALNYGGPKGAAWSICHAIAEEIADGKNLDTALQEAEQRGAERERLGPLTEDLEFILGRPNFALGPIAHAYRRAGHEIERKSECEQAFVMHRMLMLYLEHRDGWRDAFNAELDTVCARAKQQESTDV